MTTSAIRKKLHQFIDTIDNKKATAIYTLFKSVMDTEEQRKKLVMAERENYLAGEGKSFEWEEVKAMAINKR